MSIKFLIPPSPDIATGSLSLMTTPDSGSCSQSRPSQTSLSGHKIKILRDDKGGEYMSNAFTKFTTDCGIERQHTVRAKAFWGEALGALVHVWNRCPIDAVKNATPYQLWNGTKPDASHLRVWRCTAYVHIQKDKRTGLTWRSASLLVTLRATRAGNSTTQLQRRLSSQRELTLMRDTSLCLSILHQPLSLLQV